MARVVHLFTMAYVFGQSFAVLVASETGMMRHGTGGAAYVLEQVALVLILLSGALAGSLHVAGKKGKFGKTRYGWLMFAKVLLWLLLTPLTDMLALAWVGEKGQVHLTDAELYFVRALKAVLLLAAFSVGSYARIFRETVTWNFTQLPGQKKASLSSEMLEAPVEGQ